MSDVAHRSVLAASAVLIGCLTNGLRAQSAPTAPLTLEAALARAAEAGPAAVAARLQHAIAVANVGLARERPNPEGHFEFSKDTPHENYSVLVPVETAGKRARRIEVSQAAVQVSDADLARALLDIRSTVRRAYFSRLVALDRLGVQRELQSVATRARDAAQARFDDGSAPRLEVLQAELALAQVGNELRAAQAAADAARIELDALLGLPLDAGPPLTTPADAAPVPAAADASARALAANPEIASLDRQIAEADARVRLAKANQVPDIAPEVGLSHGAEPEFTYGWRAAVGITLPILTQHKAAVAVENATLSALKGARTATALRVAGDVLAAAVTAEARRAQLVEYRDDIVPRALAVERMAEDSYRLGQTPLIALLTALQATRDVRLRSLDAAAEFQNAVGDLERAIGAPLP